jgi:hypothetical protein
VIEDYEKVPVQMRLSSVVEPSVRVNTFSRIVINIIIGAPHSFKVEDEEVLILLQIMDQFRHNISFRMSKWAEDSYHNKILFNYRIRIYCSCSGTAGKIWFYISPAGTLSPHDYATWGITHYKASSLRCFHTFQHYIIDLDVFGLACCGSKRIISHCAAAKSDKAGS